MPQMDPVNNQKTSKYPAPLYVSDIEACPDRASFLQLVMPYYQAACKELGIKYPGVCALQCIYETGVPTTIAHSLRANNNMGGLKGGGQPGASRGETVTDGTGGFYSKFESVDKYIYAAVWNIVNSGYYGDALAANDMESFARNLIRVWVGHDGDAYAPDVINDYYKYGLGSYENDGTGSVNGGQGAQSGASADSSTGSIAGLSFDTSVRERKTARVEEGSHPNLKTFYRINMTGAQFIRQVLAPYCKSKATGQGAYRLWFDDETSPDGAPGVRLNFKPDQYNSIEDRVSNKLLPNVDKTYEFSFASGPQSSVLSFDPNYAGIVTSVTGGYEVDAATTEAITNDLISLKYNRFSDENRPSTGDSVFDDLQGTFRIGDSSYSYNDVANRAANLWYNMAPYGYTADMTVLGDPTIDVQKLCSVAVYTPQGLPHYSSGVYLITHVSDSISGGTFTTTMNLVRNAISIGTNDSGGIDITVGSTDTVYVGDAANLAGGSASSNATSGNTTVSPQAANAAIQTAVDWAIGIANDDSHGYNFGARGPVDYDCSGLVTSSYVQAGVMHSTPGTSSMKSEMLPCGFVEHLELLRDCTNAQVGDVYINEGVHTAMYIGNGQIVHAAGSENKAADNWKYGTSGDQNQKEILIAPWYDDGWTTVLRYGG